VSPLGKEKAAHASGVPKEYNFSWGWIKGNNIRLTG
jgi:hypothetical protein